MDKLSFKVQLHGGASGCSWSIYDFYDADNGGRAREPQKLQMVQFYKIVNFYVPKKYV